jgi:hypothetical protein
MMVALAQVHRRGVEVWFSPRYGTARNYDRAIVSRVDMPQALPNMTASCKPSLLRLDVVDADIISALV